MTERYMVIGDLYNRIFSVQISHPEVLVDYVTWNQIFASLPMDYQLPDMPIFTRNVSK